MGAGDRERAGLGEQPTIAATLAVEGALEGSPGDILDGSLFAGRYQLLRELGRGGMGTVYEAHDTLVGERVALKTLELAGADTGVIERFRREVRLARRITHPNVARTHDLGDHDGRHYLTMELVRGVDLATILAREGPLALARALGIAAQICEGLAAAHAAGVIHRDLKPANVLLDDDGRVLLTDFGIARASAAEGEARTLGTIGTLVYMAPEQLTGVDIDLRADLYAFGLLVYEMITGALAFTGETPLAAAIARLSAPPPDLAQAAPHAPAALAALVGRCLARDRDERPASAAEVLMSLATCLDEHVSEDMSLKTETSRAPADVRIAVLPLRVLGGGDRDGFGEGLHGAIIDVLGRTRGVRVQGSGAISRIGDERDPAVIGRSLGVAFVIDGSLQRVGAAIRVSVRAVDVRDGVQLWSGRFTGDGDDLFALSDRLALQIGEALRTELTLTAYRDRIAAADLALYRGARTTVLVGVGAVFDEIAEDFDRVAAAHPDFQPLIALRAVLGMRGWFVSGFAGGVDWQTRARAALADAEAVAGDSPETLLAAAMCGVQDGRYRDAVLALGRAIDGAPGYAPALQYLGSLQCEAGRVDEGLLRIRLALDLDPRIPAGLFELARCAGLRGDWAECDALLERLRKNVANQSPVLLVAIRAAAWRGDREAVRALQLRVRTEPGPIMVHLDAYAEAMLSGQLLRLDFVDRMLAKPVSPRFRVLLRQVTCEQLCLAGAPARALATFIAAADDMLIDLEWCDRCPLLASIRGLPGFAEARLRVRERVQSIWARV